MSPFHVFENGPKEVDKRMDVTITADGNNDFCAQLNPLKNDRMKVKMTSFDAYGITESGKILDGEGIVKAESFLIYDGINPKCQKIVVYSKEKLKTREEWFREWDKLMSQA